MYILLKFASQQTPTLPHAPVFIIGKLKGMFMMPSRSSLGTRDLKIALNRMASPLPASMSCKATYAHNNNNKKKH